MTASLARLMSHWTLLLPILGILLLASGGCVQYRAGLQQRFASNGTSQLNVTEHLTINTQAMEDYTAQLPANSSLDGQRLMASLRAYYEDGPYAAALCRHAPGLDGCRAGADGGVNWQATLQPEGRFYTASHQTDWFNLREITTYQISRLPLIHYEVYRQTDPALAAKAEWEDLRHYLQSSLGPGGDAAWTDANPATPPILLPDSPLAGAVQQYAPVRVPEQIVDFEGGQLRGQPMAAGNKAANGRSMEMAYEALFADPILVASIGGQPLVLPDEHRVLLASGSEPAPPAGRIVVVTQRSLSPLGAYTWVIPIVGIAVTVARDFIFGDKRLWREEEE
ncbi:MAG: hypothetical protein M1530_02230 [Candidatus Marsarchaeota archaeon]|nr:hypothetical protein [Candidatus Marsarchaeota archaeon]